MDEGLDQEGDDVVRIPMLLASWVASLLQGSKFSGTICWKNGGVVLRRCGCWVRGRGIPLMTCHSTNPSQLERDMWKWQ